MILCAKHALTGSHTQAGRFDEALALKEEILPLFQDVRGPEDPMTLGLLSNLAHGYEQAGRIDEAIECGEELVEIRRKLDPASEKTATLTAMQDLVGFYEAAGEGEKAENLREQLPPETPDSAGSPDRKMPDRSDRVAERENRPRPGEKPSFNLPAVPRPEP